MNDKTCDSELEARYRAYFEHTAEGWFVVSVASDDRFIIEELNPAHERLTGLNTADAQGKEPKDILPPAEAAAVVANYRRCLELGTTQQYEEVLTLPGGKRHWETILTPMRDASGRIARILGSARDVTQSRLAWAEAERSRRELEQIAHAVPDILYVFDLDAWRTVFLNRRSQTMLGYTPEELNEGGIDLIYSLVHPEDLPGLTGHFQSMRALADEKVAYAEYRARHRDGTYRWFATRRMAFSRKADAGLESIIGVITDISDRKAAEQQNRELTRQLLALQDEERRRIARDLHDTTGQHLTVIDLGLAHLEQVLDARSGTAAILQDVRGALEEARRSIRASTYLLHPPELDESGLVATLRRYVGGLSKRTELDIRLSTDGHVHHLGPEIEMVLFRVVQEALSNIYRHADAKRIDIRLAATTQDVTLEVEDDGRGIARSLADDDGNGGDLGVGIPGMRARVRQNHGQLDILPLSPGTLVRVRLPLRELPRPS